MIALALALALSGGAHDPRAGTPDPAAATTVERAGEGRHPPRADDRDAAMLKELDLLESMDLLENLELFGVDSTAR